MIKHHVPAMVEVWMTHGSVGITLGRSVSIVPICTLVSKYFCCSPHNTALELTEDLPSTEVLERWAGEPVKAVIIPTKIFLTNKAGYPALSQKHKMFLIKMFKVVLFDVLAKTL